MGEEDQGIIPLQMCFHWNIWIRHKSLKTFLLTSYNILLISFNNLIQSSTINIKMYRNIFNCSIFVVVKTKIETFMKNIFINIKLFILLLMLIKCLIKSFLVMSCYLRKTIRFLSNTTNYNYKCIFQELFIV